MPAERGGSRMATRMWFLMGLLATAALLAASPPASATGCTLFAPTYIADCGVGPLPGNVGVGFTIGLGCYNVRAQAGGFYQVVGAPCG